MNYSEVKKIRTRNDFIFFLKSLRKDYFENTSSWENKDIGAFLEGMASWIEDMEGFYENQGLPTPENLNWKAFADILMGGKSYE